MFGMVLGHAWEGLKTCLGRELGAFRKDAWRF